MYKTYSDEFKQNIIKRYEQGEALKDLSGELDIALSTLYHWRTKYCTVNTTKRVYTPNDIEKLNQRLVKAQNKLDVIQLSGYMKKIPLSSRLDTLEEMYNKPDNPYSVHELCEALEVARGTFYNHIFRRADRSKEKAEKERLMQLVQQVFDDNQQCFGAKKIKTILTENGVTISVKHVSDIMHELGLESVRTDAKKQYIKWQRYEKKNILNRDFSADYPNQIWVSDITQLKINGYWMYLCVIIDLYSRKVVGYKVSKSASTHMVTSTFKSAFLNRGKPQNLTFHSDRGAQYTSVAFEELLRTSHVRQSFSRSGRPCDNAVAETFFATFKKEEAYRRKYTSERGFRKSVEQYIRFYNEDRPHKTLAYKTPVAFEAVYFDKK